MIDFDSILSEIYPLLNAVDAEDLVWWTDAQIREWMDEASNRLGATGVFAEYAGVVTESQIDVTADGAGYALPVRCSAVARATLDGSALRPASSREMDARSSAWETETGTPDRFLLDTAGTGTIRLYKTPTSTGTLELVYHSFPAVESGSTHRAPSVFGIWHKYSTLAGARAAQTDGHAPDVAAAAQARADVIEQVCRLMFGGVK